MWSQPEKCDKRYSSKKSPKNCRAFFFADLILFYILWGAFRNLLRTKIRNNLIISGTLVLQISIERARMLSIPQAGQVPLPSFCTEDVLSFMSNESYSFGFCVSSMCSYHSYF
jgi:hypothetical protein